MMGLSYSQDRVISLIHLVTRQAWQTDEVWTNGRNCQCRRAPQHS